MSKMMKFVTVLAASAALAVSGCTASTPGAPAPVATQPDAVLTTTPGVDSGHGHVNLTDEAREDTYINKLQEARAKATGQEVQVLSEDSRANALKTGMFYCGSFESGKRLEDLIGQVPTHSKLNVPEMLVEAQVAVEVLCPRVRSVPRSDEPVVTQAPDPEATP